VVGKALCGPAKGGRVAAPLQPARHPQAGGARSNKPGPRGAGRGFERLARSLHPDIRAVVPGRSYDEPFNLQTAAAAAKPKCFLRAGLFKNTSAVNIPVTG